MKPIGTTACIGIDQGCLQVIIAQEPTECAHRAYHPFGSAIDPPRRETGRNRCRRLDWLLIERCGFSAEPAKAFGPNGSEKSG
jgi:hypothetical protein